MTNNRKCKVILQARVSSTRMPQKTILKFHEGKGILEILIERIKKQIPSNDIIIATSTQKENDAIVEIANKTQVHFFRGDENDVLNRFIKAAEIYNTQNIVRVCSDNVFMDISDLKRLYDLGQSNLEHDYLAYMVNGKPNILTHYGLWGELVTYQALVDTFNRTQNPYYREHVTNYIYTNSDLYQLKWIDPFYVPTSSSIRLTTDTKDDFDVQKNLFKQIYNQYGLDFDTNQIIKELKKHPEYTKSMSLQIKQNEK